MPSFAPTLPELIKLAVDAKLGAARVALPARVERYDSSKQLIDAKPLLKDATTGEDNERIPVSLPVVCNVPLVFPGGGGYRLTLPVATGDTVLLVFADRSLDLWLSKGGEQDPGETTQHDLSDAIAIPGLHDSLHAWTGASTSSMTLGKDGGPQIEIKSSEITLNGGSLSVARETDSVSAAPGMAGWIANVVAALGTLGQVVVPPTDFGTISGGASGVKA